MTERRGETCWHAAALRLHRSLQRSQRRKLPNDEPNALVYRTAQGFPVLFGFPVPTSLTVAANIPYRPTFDSIRGGHAVLAAGYDDQKGTSPKGVIRNS